MSGCLACRAPRDRTWSDGGLGQLGKTNEVVPGQGHVRPELVVLHTPVAELTAASHGLDPPEDLVYPLSDPLAQPIALMPGRAPVDGRTPLLSHMGGDVHVPAIPHKVHRVISFEMSRIRIPCLCRP